MANFNKVFLIGNLTRDPELRYTPQGTAVANLRMAVNRRYKDKTGEAKTDVCFLTVVVWDKQAEVCNQYLQKGKPLFVEGRLQSRSWEDNEGKKRNVLEVRGERIQFLGSPGDTKARTGMVEGPAEEGKAMPGPETPWQEDVPAEEDIDKSQI
ncbi:MAG: single-stranded DNA-binding protein [Candidatus Omnitrophota bacterium]